MYLCRMNIPIEKIQSFFSDLKFEEISHIYTVNNVKIKASVSKLIEDFVEKFPAKKISLRIAKQKNSKFKFKPGLSLKEKQKSILNEWDKISKEACDRGNKAHLFGEKYPFNKKLKPTTKLEEAVVKFWGSLPKHIIPVKMELKMFHKIFMFAGTADILLYNIKTGNYIIADYKTNKDLFKNFKGKKMLGIFSNLLDSPFSHYILQLSFYQILLEQIGAVVERRIVVWLRDSGEYEMYDTEDVTKKLNIYLKENHNG